MTRRAVRVIIWGAVISAAIVWWLHQQGRDDAALAVSVASPFLPP